MANATETARKYDKMQDAFAAYASENDSLTANDYAAEGYELGEAAFDMPAEDRDDWIDGQTYAFPGSARYLVAVAADYRLAELVAADAYPFVAPAYEVAA